MDKPQFFVRLHHSWEAGESELAEGDGQSSEKQFTGGALGFHDMLLDFELMPFVCWIWTLAP